MWAIKRYHSAGNSAIGGLVRLIGRQLVGDRIPSVHTIVSTTYRVDDCRLCSKTCHRFSHTLLSQLLPSPASLRLVVADLVRIVMTGRHIGEAVSQTHSFVLDPAAVFYAYIGLGDKQAALSWLERA